MKSMELTDFDGDALTIITRGDFTWLTCTSGRDEVTVGPLPTVTVHHAFSTRGDGGVTAGTQELHRVR